MPIIKVLGFDALALKSEISILFTLFRPLQYLFKDVYIAHASEK